ncbi:MAG TPA: winged helix-turn-helix domain-containing protein [Bryobacteraceae bacterium]|nr:winged helix-turn-helix domain-containing protein [Bryobacteraceae bacterium]
MHALLESGGRVVSKAELMQLVWPDCVVEEGGLARNISLLRKVPGDDAETYIQTVPKRGCRFVTGIPPQLPPARAPAGGGSSLR